VTVPQAASPIASIDEPMNTVASRFVIACLLIDDRSSVTVLSGAGRVA